MEDTRDEGRNGLVVVSWAQKAQDMVAWKTFVDAAESGLLRE